MAEPRLYYVDGVRHSAVVLAGSKKEAIKLAISASGRGRSDERVLYGFVGKWEIPEARELKLPREYLISKRHGRHRQDL